MEEYGITLPYLAMIVHDFACDWNTAIAVAYYTAICCVTTDVAWRELHAI